MFSPMAKLKENSAGLTLVGVLVAVLVFSVMLIAVTQLMARSEKTIGISREEFIATNLAREALELTQYIRDSNWLSRGHTAPLTGRSNPPDHSWVGHPFQNQPLCDGLVTNRVLTIEFDQDQGAIVADEAGNPRLLLLDTANGHYFHTTNLSGGRPSVPSPFSRTITVNCAQQNATTPVQNEHIIVTSRVWWTSRGQNREVTVSTKLYNWYQ